mmetsp:Transcript_109754/g.310496  ORF Transcript_109754/g.310496 Transcript_109754/m.310496 type:complete len:145 (+) Transcript_109754:83-517(+)
MVMAGSVSLGGIDAEIALTVQSALARMTWEDTVNKSQHDNKIASDLDNVAQMMQSSATIGTIRPFGHKQPTTTRCEFCPTSMCAYVTDGGYTSKLHTKNNTRLNPLRRARRRARQRAMEAALMPEPEILVVADNGGHRKLVISL